MGLGTTPESAIPRQSLPSAVADKLRDRIIRGEIAEGTQLRQDAIATQYQVSRVPVREALRQLEAEGLITIVPNRGAVVPALSPDDIEELFSIRSLLEPEVLKRSIPHLTEEDFSQAEAILKTFVNELRRDDHVSSWGRLNWQFHSTLYSKANQPRFMVARFTISCCVADAVAIGVIVQSDQAAKLAPDSWVHVNGKFQVQDFDKQKTPILVADSVQPTTQPDQPYLYP